MKNLKDYSISEQKEIEKYIAKHQKQGYDYFKSVRRGLEDYESVYWIEGFSKWNITCEK